MDIEQEQRELIKEQDGEGLQVKGRRGRKKKQEWEETIEIFFPSLDQEEVADEKKSTQKEDIKQKKTKPRGKKQKEPIESEDKLSLSERIKQIHHREGHFKLALDLNEYYHTQIDAVRDQILQDNFTDIINRIEHLLLEKIQEQGSFLNYIQLIVERSHMNLLNEFNSKCISHFKYRDTIRKDSYISEDNSRDNDENNKKDVNEHTKMEEEEDNSNSNSNSEGRVHIVRYQGSNQLYKILSSLREGIEQIKQMKQLRSQLNAERGVGNQNNEHEGTQCKQVIMCMLEGVHEVGKQDMIDIGKYLVEEYEWAAESLSIVVLFPVSTQQWVSDIQIFAVDFCKSRDLFVKFLLFLLKADELPLFSPETLLSLLTEFNLYHISYSEAIRRIKMAITAFIFQNPQHLQLLQSLQQHDHKQIQQAPHPHSSALFQQFQTKKQEIKSAVIFLERLYGSQFSNPSCFERNVLDTNHRVIELALNKNRKYVMPQQQQDSFMVDAATACQTIRDHLQDSQTQGKDFFSRYVRVFDNLDSELRKDIDLQKKITASANLSRYDKQQQLKKMQQQIHASIETDSKAASGIKRDKVESIVRELVTYSLHLNFKSGQFPMVERKEVNLDKLCRPDMLGSLFSKFNDVIGQDELSQPDNKNNIDIMDGMILLKLCEECGRNISITESFTEYNSYMREKGTQEQRDTVHPSYYNAVCQLRYKGLIEEKRKLKNQFIKHFFSKSSFYTLTN